MIAGSSGGHGVRAIAVISEGLARVPVPFLNVHAISDRDGRSVTILINDFIPAEQVRGVRHVPKQSEHFSVCRWTRGCMQEEQTGCVLTDANHHFFGQSCLDSAICSSTICSNC